MGLKNLEVSLCKFAWGLFHSWIYGGQVKMEKPLFKAPKIANLYQCYPNAHFTVTIIFHRFYQMCKCDFKNHVFKTHITYLQKRIFLNNLPK